MYRGSTWVKLLLFVLGLHTIILYVAYIPARFSRTTADDVTRHLESPTETIVQAEVAVKPEGPVKPEVPMPREERRVNAIVTEYDTVLRSRFRSLMDRKAGPRDLEVIALIRDLLDPPSPHMVKTSRKIVSTPQSSSVDKVLKSKKNGFFIECGALDGERSSNTIELEQKKGWTGILIEMDPYFYTQLRGKNRRSHSLNACLSPDDYPTEMEFKESSGGLGTLLDGATKRKGRGRKVPCFPLESILLALNQSHVDFFSLDVEGFELEILKTIPFDRLDISTFAVEYAHGRSGKPAYSAFMAEKGYVVHQDIHNHNEQIGLYVDDFIFVKKDLKV